MASGNAPSIEDYLQYYMQQEYRPPHFEEFAHHMQQYGQNVRLPGPAGVQHVRPPAGPQPGPHAPQPALPGLSPGIDLAIILSGPRKLNVLN